MSTSTLIVVISVLAIGTYGLRLGGVLLARRVSGGDQAERDRAEADRGEADRAGPGRGRGAAVTWLLPYAAVALLAALAATSATTDSGEFAGIARPAGVVVGLVAGLVRAPFVVAVVLAAAVSAGLRLLGVP